VSGSPVELRATYRLQLNAEFGFAAARERLPYLRDLGVSHLYLSPIMRAREGSMHGYDVLDPRHVSGELGGEQEFRSLAADARGAGLGLIVDFVPNHMAAVDENEFWADPELRSKFFDVDESSGWHRRFFDIDELAGVREEDPDVFDELHSLVLSFVSEGLVDGLRIDHPDGLADPAGYLARLRAAGVERVWVEKILDPDERLRDWPVCGTVGYEFLNDACALFVDPAGWEPLTELWKEISGDRRPFPEIAAAAKLEQVRTTFWPEVEQLVRELGGDDPSVGLARIAQALASLPVYRTYVDAVNGVVAEEDRAVIAQSGITDELASMLLLERSVRPEFVTRFQQTTPAVMAKGVEDTAFYRYARLLALNDVGGDPARFSIDVGRFHAGCIERAERFPLSMLSTMTHDAKRSGDVRARIGALSYMPSEWETHVSRWMEMTEELRADGAPDDVERYLVFQTLVGAWPISVERLQEYMEKALREAKRNTSWVEQDNGWEGSVRSFCRKLLDPSSFMEDFLDFAGRVALLGDRAALGQLVLKLTAPGIPDIYQGDELPLLALVDPDNRRPVDWQWHQAMLSRLMGGSQPDRETFKLWVTLGLLTLRARRGDVFPLGAYQPLDAGASACAFLRGDDVLVVVWVRPGSAVDGSFEAPAGRWRDVLSGQERSFSGRGSLADVLPDWGAAVLERV
jgi:(1->4)-alpha-D-glucan 1-alpha-D-glucosylmutase